LSLLCFVIALLCDPLDNPQFKWLLLSVAVSLQLTVADDHK